MKNFRGNPLLFLFTVCVSGALVLSSPVHADGYDRALYAYTRALHAYDEGDIEIALTRLNKLAEKGDVRAQNKLGLMHITGDGVTQDYQKAVSWLQLAALEGYSHAQYNLGERYSRGEGVAQNQEEAAKWFQMAAMQGLSAGQINLGVLYYSGQGVPRDYIHAHKWFNIAAYNGHFTAAANRDSMEEQMTAADIDQAKELAEQCINSLYRACQSGI